MPIDNSNSILYKETDVSNQFSLEKVHSMLISISPKTSNPNVYSVDKSEVDDIIHSMNNWNIVLGYNYILLFS